MRKVWEFLQTPRITRMSRIRAKPENRSAKQDPKQKRIKERETWCSRGPKPCYRRCLLLETIVLASCLRRARRSSPATFSTQLLSVLSVRSVVTLSFALFISPSRSFSGALRSEAGSERHPTWGRFSILATREFAPQPPVRANRGQSQICVRVIPGQFPFGAREATIFSKRGSPRSESHDGSRRRSPYDAPAGILASVSSCSIARSRSPVQAQITAKK